MTHIISDIGGVGAKVIPEATFIAESRVFKNFDAAPLFFYTYNLIRFILPLLESIIAAHSPGLSQKFLGLYGRYKDSDLISNKFWP